MRYVLGLFGLAISLSGQPLLAGDSVPTMDQLLHMSQCELEALYRGAEVGPEPCGFIPGKAIFDPGTSKTVRKSKLTHVVWKGKEFPGDATMINHTVAGLRAVKAKVYVGESWLDGKPTLVLDYCGTSKLFADVRDEMRILGPCVYLGITYVRKPDGPKLSNFYALDGR